MGLANYRNSNNSTFLNPSKNQDATAIAFKVRDVEHNDVITARVDNASAVLISPQKASARGTVIQTVLGIDATVTSFRKFTVTADLVRVDGRVTEAALSRLRRRPRPK